MEAQVIRTLKSRKNDNVYNLYTDKIVVQTKTGVKEIFLPADIADCWCFYDIYYIQDKLFAILVKNGNYDLRIAIDEDEHEFSGSPIPTY